MTPSFYQNQVKRKREKEGDEVRTIPYRASRQKNFHPYYWGLFVVIR
ncbi:MAG: hypothetical protein RMK98_05185 [Bacteroidia bacterium]|nr:hypothetical protein [Bacteroidia bacterium]